MADQVCVVLPLQPMQSSNSFYFTARLMGPLMFQCRLFFLNMDWVVWTSACTADSPASQAATKQST